MPVENSPAQQKEMLKDLVTTLLLMIQLKSKKVKNHMLLS